MPQDLSMINMDEQLGIHFKTWWEKNLKNWKPSSYWSRFANWRVESRILNFCGWARVIFGENKHNSTSFEHVSCFFSHICMSRGATSNSRRRDRCHSYIVVTAMYFELIDCYEPAPAPASFPLCVIVKMCFTKLSTNNFSKKEGWHVSTNNDWLSRF